ncbi:GNAT family N-acetyltransferase [Lederbergia citrea]|uniref:N-acetyltransferase n=1 Tax=Lederbergia citrea TaxID=2833581 RepID=A0A942UNU8_9BACI|nr:N-acetyltransferase [Lederbergia citrea]MBS4175990.1 N-acetyltransferase [Lederbergia citrea]MBS4202551.1 N-acetyltransferase [Lederbergia citrea]MBS4222782.1 N-acetyltransferase [Lederbergia citrea]
MIIRTELPTDHRAVCELTYQAFGKRKDESELIDRIRKSSGFIPELSIVAEEDEEIVGHILLSKAKVIGDTGDHEVIVLAPVAVHPSYQKKGVGSKLIEEGLNRVKALNYGLVLLIGHPSYYLRFGFKPARQYGLELHQFNVPDEVFMVCELNEGELNRIHGELRYPSAFFE